MLGSGEPSYGRRQQSAQTYHQGLLLCPAAADIGSMLQFNALCPGVEHLARGESFRLAVMGSNSVSCAQLSKTAVGGCMIKEELQKVLRDWQESINAQMPIPNPDYP
jgi:hypothetical protein